MALLASDDGIGIEGAWGQDKLQMSPDPAYAELDGGWGVDMEYFVQFSVSGLTGARVVSAGRFRAVLV